jgi:hypothetical protein
MGVYSNMLSDEILLKAVEDFKRIIIVGCGGCANDSLAHDKNIPQRMIFLDQLGVKPAPDAVTEEANRLKGIFKSKIKDVGVAFGAAMCSLCVDEKTDELEWVKACRDVEAVIVLSCSAGVIGVKTRLGKTAKVIPGMKTVGLHFSYYKVFDVEKGLFCVDKEKSAFIRFSK